MHAMYVHIHLKLNVDIPWAQISHSGPIACKHHVMFYLNLDVQGLS